VNDKPSALLGSAINPPAVRLAMRHARMEALALPDRARQALDVFLGSMPAEVRSRIREAILYGSVARGESGPESDIDLYVVWEGSEEQAFRLLSEAAVEALIATGVVVSPHAVSLERHQSMQRNPTLFMENVQRDGISISA
jgi:predicted nucleotidyltransferase